MHSHAQRGNETKSVGDQALHLNHLEHSIFSACFTAQLTVA